MARERGARGWRWAAAVAALALLPKCVVCVAGYVAALAGFAAAGAEICGVGAARAGAAHGWVFAGMVVALGGAGGWWWSRRRGRTGRAG